MMNIIDVKSIIIYQFNTSFFDPAGGGDPVNK